MKITHLKKLLKIQVMAFMSCKEKKERNQRHLVQDVTGAQKNSSQLIFRNNFLKVCSAGLQALCLPNQQLKKIQNIQRSEKAILRTQRCFKSDLTTKNVNLKILFVFSFHFMILLKLMLRIMMKELNTLQQYFIIAKNKKKFVRM